MKKPKPSGNPVSQEAADAFEMYMREYQQAFNLMDWRIEKDPKPAGRKALAEVRSMSLRDRLAMYSLANDFGHAKPVTEQSLRELACHETGHVLLHELIEVCRNPASSEEDIEAAEHRVIHVMVRNLVPEN